MAWIIGYGCSTAAGPSSKALWNSLIKGRDHRVPMDTSSWPVGSQHKGAPHSVAFLWPTCDTLGGSVREKLGRQLLTSWSEAQVDLDSNTRKRLKSGQNLGVILASTKSFVDDFIWRERSASLEQSLAVDPLSILLRDFLRAAQLQPARQIVVSNACASSLSALALAQDWLRDSDITDVLVVAADAVGPFVVRGFETLRVLTTDAVRSFAKERSGFHLGEASAAILLSKENVDANRIYLRGAGIDAEGFAVTRPSLTGQSLRRACLAIDQIIEAPPELIIAHGTGTVVNDQIEDLVYSELFNREHAPWVTGTKWCVGHTLGACGAVDVIAAILVLEHQAVFRLMQTPASDPEFKSQYLTRDCEYQAQPIHTIMTSSLGFGGVHAAALVELRS